MEKETEQLREQMEKQLREQMEKEKQLREQIEKEKQLWERGNSSGSRRNSSAERDQGTQQTTEGFFPAFLCVL